MGPKVKRNVLRDDRKYIHGRQNIDYFITVLENVEKLS